MTHTDLSKSLSETTHAMAFDAKRMHYRGQFPLLKKLVWLDHAAHGLWSTTSVKAMKDFIDSFCEGPLYDWTEWNAVMEGVRGLLARLLNASTDEIGFNYNTSLSLMLLSRCVDWHKGDNIVIPDREFPSVVMPGKLLSQWGVEARVVESVGDLADADKLLGAIDSRTRMMMVSLVNFLTGQRLDIKKLAKACRDAGVVLVVDAIQAAGPIKIDVKDLGCHALCFGSPKWMMSAMGIGCMYVERDSIDLLSVPQVGMFSVPEPWNFFDYDQPLVCSTNRYECGTQPVISHFGYKPILEMFLDLGPENIERYLLDLTGRLHDELTKRGVKVLTPRADKDRAAIVTFDAASAGWSDAQSLRDTLFKQGVVVSVRMGLVRLSPHFYNTWEEVERFLELTFAPQ